MTSLRPSVSIMLVIFATKTIANLQSDAGIGVICNLIAGVKLTDVRSINPGVAGLPAIIFKLWRSVYHTYTVTETDRQIDRQTRRERSVRERKCRGQPPTRKGENQNVVLTRCQSAYPPVCIRTHKNDHVHTLKILPEFDGLQKHEKNHQVYTCRTGLPGRKQRRKHWTWYN